jgi:hypothetical protein
MIVAEYAAVRIAKLNKFSQTSACVIITFSFWKTFSPTSIAYLP